MTEEESEEENNEVIDARAIQVNGLSQPAAVYHAYNKKLRPQDHHLIMSVPDAPEFDENWLSDIFANAQELHESPAICEKYGLDEEVIQISQTVAACALIKPNDEVIVASLGDIWISAVPYHTMLKGIERCHLLSGSTPGAFGNQRLIRINRNPRVKAFDLKDAPYSLGVDRQNFLLIETPGAHQENTPEERRKKLPLAQQSIRREITAEFIAKAFGDHSCYLSDDCFANIVVPLEKHPERCVFVALTSGSDNEVDNGGAAWSHAICDSLEDQALQCEAKASVAPVV